jgi:hypothetical protein
MALSISNKRWLSAIILMIVAIALIDYIVNSHQDAHSTIINPGLKNKTLTK